MYYTTIHESTEALRSPPRPRAVYAPFVHPSSTPVLAGPLRGASITPVNHHGGGSGAYMGGRNGEPQPRAQSPSLKPKRDVYYAPAILPANTLVTPPPSHVLPQPSSTPTMQYPQQPTPIVITLAPPTAAPLPHGLGADWDLQRKVASVDAKLDQLLHATSLPPPPAQHYAYTSSQRGIAMSSSSYVVEPYATPSHFVYGPSVSTAHVSAHHPHTSYAAPPYSVPYVDAAAVARDLYGPLPTLSPPRAAHLAAGGVRRVAPPPFGAIEVPPPPVLPTYFPARDHIDEVESSYAWLVLRNLLRDVEDAEIRDRLRVMEEQVISAGRLEEQRVELRALHKESLAEERLAALDAEAMLRRHYATVARGELHRAVVDEDLVRVHAEREASPDGRRGREMLERSHHPSPARRTVVATTTTASQPVMSSRQRTSVDQMQPSYLQAGPSPILRTAASERTPYIATPYNDSVLTFAGAGRPGPSASSRVTVTSSSQATTSASNRASEVSKQPGLPPVPISPTRGAPLHYQEELPGRGGVSSLPISHASRVSNTSHLAQVAKDMGADPITQREVQHAENVMTNAEYQASRRRYKKALMQQALS